MMKYPLWLCGFSAVIALWLVLVSSGKKDGDGMEAYVGKYSPQWSGYIARNDIKGLIRSTVEVFGEAVDEGNVPLATYSGIHASQAFLFSGCSLP